MNRYRTYYHYVDPWQSRRINSTEMTVNQMEWLEDNGFVWVRPVVRAWAATLRNPVMGRPLEFSRVALPESVLVDSREGRRLLREIAVR
jgi:hypothetical protein